VTRFLLFAGTAVAALAMFYSGATPGNQWWLTIPAGAWLGYISARASKWSCLP
jgi:hypothetical protein